MILRKVLQPILLLFFGVNIFCGFSFQWLYKNGLDPYVLMTGNLIVCALTLISFYLLYKGLTAKSTTGFLSSVYSSFLLKLFIAGIIVVLYSKIAGPKMNMPAVFTSMVLYLVYMFIELRGLLTIIKKD